MIFSTNKSNDFMEAVMRAINRLLLDILAAGAYKDYKERERKQAEGIKKAKAAGKYKGRAVDLKLLEQVRKLSESGDFSINEMASVLKKSRATIIRYRKRLNESK